MSQEPEGEYQRPYSILAVFPSYLIPGLGQISQGRTGKGVLFMVLLLSLFHVGEAMGNWQNVDATREENPENGSSLNPLRSIFNHAGTSPGRFGSASPPGRRLWQFYGGAVPSRDTNPFLHEYQRQPNEGRIEGKGHSQRAARQ